MNDQQIQTMLLQTTLPPPSAAWDQLLLTLDELEEDRPLQQQLLSVSIEQPAAVWSLLEEMLSDKELANDLAHNEIPVPNQIWERINLQLDQAADKELAQQLNELEMIAPTENWTIIEQLLPKEPAKLIPFTKQYATVVKLAAAAIFTGLITWGVFSYFNSSQKYQTTIANAEPKQSAKNNPFQATAEAPTNTATTSSTIISIPSVKQQIKKSLHLPVLIAQTDPVHHDAESIVSKEEPRHKSTQPIETDKGFAESQYLVVLNEEGELIRVSKKLSNMHCAQNPEGLPVDATTALLSKNCDDQIKRWQQRIANSTAISPSAGYIDLAEIILATEK